MAIEIHNKLKSKSARLSAVKEQILIRYLGLGWDDAHHPWSANGELFNSKHLLNHFVQNVLPLADTLEVMEDAPIHFPTPPYSMVLGTESELSFQFKYGNENVVENFKTSARAKRKSLEEEGKKHPNFFGFKIEMLFEYKNDDGTRYLIRCNGVVDSIFNEKSNYVMIKWNKDSLGPNDADKSREKLLPSKWNPEKAPSGSWREYFEQ
jgi:hypothetical protein